jgi:hypothetical protein
VLIAPEAVAEAGFAHVVEGLWTVAENVAVYQVFPRKTAFHGNLAIVVLFDQSLKDFVPQIQQVVIAMQGFAKAE